MAKKAIISFIFALLLLPCLFAAYRVQTGTQFKIRWIVDSEASRKFEILEFSRDEVIPDNGEVALEYNDVNQRVCKVQYTTNAVETINFTCKSTALKTNDNHFTAYTLRMTRGNVTKSLSVGCSAETEYVMADTHSIYFEGNGFQTENILVYAELSTENDPYPGKYSATITFGVETE